MAEHANVDARQISCSTAAARVAVVLAAVSGTHITCTCQLQLDEQQAEWVGRLLGWRTFGGGLL